MVLIYPNPIIRGPWADIFPRIVHLQDHPHCADRELKVVDCMDAYGFYRGQDKCRALLEDMYECVTAAKRHRRVELMMDERERQEKSGQRKPEDRPHVPTDLF